jgi:hypothetical protein
MNSDLPECPQCGETHVARIVYGHPTGELLDEVKAGHVVLHDGAASGDSPNWHCNKCDHEW